VTTRRIVLRGQGEFRMWLGCTGHCHARISICAAPG
jgi:hypothetical protein